MRVQAGGLGPWRSRSREAVSQPGRTPPAFQPRGLLPPQPCLSTAHPAQSSRDRLRPTFLSSSALPQGLWAPTLPDLQLPNLQPILARTLQQGEAGQLPASHLALWGQLSTPSQQTPWGPQHSAQGQGGLVIRHRTDHLQPPRSQEAVCISRGDVCGGLQGQPPPGQSPGLGHQQIPLHQ